MTAGRLIKRIGTYVISMWLIALVLSAVGLAISLVQVSHTHRIEAVLQVDRWWHTVTALLPFEDHYPVIGPVFSFIDSGLDIGSTGGQLASKWQHINLFVETIPFDLIHQTQADLPPLQNELHQFFSMADQPINRQLLRGLGLDQVMAKVREWDSQIGPVKQILPELAILLGYESPQHYVVLLQNNMELRPTGGFMGSYAEFWLDQGKFRDLAIQDIYVPDGQIKGYVKEPDPIRKYLFNNQHPGWRLRDANWDPDFPTAAKAINWFFKEGDMAPADGLVAITLAPVMDVLELIGPIPVADYNLELTRDNFYQLTQQQVEGDFFPGSTQKGDYLSAVGKTLLLSLENRPELIVTFLPVVFKNLQENQILIYTKHQAAAEYLRARGWDGHVIGPVCPENQPQCQADFVYWNEANLGINKTNCCIVRNWQDMVDLSKPETISHRWTLTYSNNNPGKPEPPLNFGGGYKNYLRLLVPESAEVDSITINGDRLPQKNIDQEINNGIKTIGFLNLTEGGQTSRIEVVYHLPAVALPYVLTVQKQPGINAIPLAIEVMNRNGEPKQLTNSEFRLTQNQTWMP